MVLRRSEFRLLLLIAFSVSFVLFGCVSSLPAAQTDSAEVHHGNVRIYYGPNDSVFIHIKSDEWYEDGNRSTPVVYLFQINSRSRYNLPSIIDNVVIVAKEESLRINSADSETNDILLSLSDEVPTENNLEVVYGYGFARYYGIIQSPAELAYNVFPNGFYTDHDNPPIPDNCQSGGTGSYACGNDCGSLGCSLTCNPGYHACCNCVSTPSCKCIANP